MYWVVDNRAIHTTNITTTVLLTFPKIKDICALKCKIVEDYKHILAQLECGIQPDLEFILEEISLVYIYEEWNLVFFK